MASTMFFAIAETLHVPLIYHQKRFLPAVFHLKNLSRLTQSAYITTTKGGFAAF